MSMHHHFDIDIAAQYGVNAAIFLNNMLYWIKKNQANEKHFHEGRYWTYNSVDAYSKLFPYWSTKQLRLIIDKCIENDLIVKNKFNKIKYDQTSWYAFTDKCHKLLNIPIFPDGKMDFNDKANVIESKGKPIPDINTNKKQIRDCASDDARKIDDKKDKQEKRKLSDESFNKFVAMYPVQKNMLKAREIWKRKKLYLKKDEIMTKLQKFLDHDADWKDGFIPHPTTFLNGERWNDEIKIKSPDQTNKKYESKYEPIREQQRPKPLEWGKGHPGWESLNK